MDCELEMKKLNTERANIAFDCRSVVSQAIEQALQILEKHQHPELANSCRVRADDMADKFLEFFTSEAELLFEDDESDIRYEMRKQEDAEYADEARKDRMEQMRHEAGFRQPY